MQRLGMTEFVVLFALMMSIMAFSLDAMLPALNVIGDDLKVADSNDTQLIISMFVLGTVFGELLFGAVSDAIGRKPTVVIGVSIYLFGTVLALYASSLEMMVAGRIIQGFGVSGSRIGCRALVRDLYSGDHMARIMSFIMMIFILVPMLAPAVGQVLTINFDWRAIFVAFLVHAVLVLIWFTSRQKETLSTEKRVPISLSKIIESSKRILGHGKVMPYTLISGLIFGAMVLYLSTAQAMFEDFYQRGEEFPLYFAILAGGVGVAGVINGKIVLRLGMHRVTKWAVTAISLTSLILLWVSQANEGVPGFYQLMILFGLILFFVGFIFGNINAMCMEWLGGIAGIGASIVGMVSSAVAVALSVFTGQFYEGTAYPLVITFLAVGVVSRVLLSLAKRAQPVHL